MQIDEEPGRSNDRHVRGVNLYFGICVYERLPGKAISELFHAGTENSIARTFSGLFAGERRPKRSGRALTLKSASWPTYPAAILFRFASPAHAFPAARHQTKASIYNYPLISKHSFEVF